MSSIRIELASPGCCLLSLLLLPFHFFLSPFRLIITPGRRRGWRDRWM